MRNILEATWHKTQVFPDRRKTTYLKFLRRLREGSQKRCQKSSVENRILSALARLDDFLMNQLLHGHSGTTPEASWNPLSTSQGTNEDDSQNDRHPEAGLSHGQMTQNSGPEDGHDNWHAFSC